MSVFLLQSPFVCPGNFFLYSGENSQFLIINRLVVSQGLGLGRNNIVQVLSKPVKNVLATALFVCWRKNNAIVVGVVLETRGVLHPILVLHVLNI